MNEDLDPWDGRPNIVFIFADDQGYHDVGVYGATDIATPTLDRLAEEGVRFTAFYAGSNVCSPSRAALLTGAYPPRAGFSDGGPADVLYPQDEEGIHPDEITLAELLKGVGYTTGLVGKWHLGHFPPFYPTRHGFDTFWGAPYSNGMTPFYLMDGEEIIEEDPEQSLLTARYTDKALEFLDTHHREHFFLFLAHTMPHYPVSASDVFVGTSGYGVYGDAIQELDWSTAQIMDRLKALHIDDRTLVVYTSDNGGNIARGGQNLGRNTPLRGRKSYDWEGGIRVPCIMRWPGVLAENTVVTGVAALIDIYPTLANLTGAPLPEDRTIDGRDIWPMLTQGAVSPHEYFFYSTLVVRNSRWKLINGELYDLINDIGETTDLSASEPDLVIELQTALDALQQDIALNGRPIAHLDDFSEEERQPRY